MLDLLRVWREGRQRIMAKRKRYLFVCTNRRPDSHPLGSCADRGAAALHAALKERLVRAGLAQLEVRACQSSCLDVCWDGPVIAVQPDNYFYGNVSESDLDEIVEAFRDGKRVERLVLRDRQFVNPTLRESDPT